MDLPRRVIVELCGFLREADLKPHRIKYWENPVIADEEQFREAVAQLCSLYRDAASNLEQNIHTVFTPAWVIRGQNWMLPKLSKPQWTPIRQVSGYSSPISSIPTNLKRWFAFFASKTELKKRIFDFVDYFNRTMAHAFKWTYKGRVLQA